MMAVISSRESEGPTTLTSQTVSMGTVCIRSGVKENRVCSRSRFHMQATRAREDHINSDLDHRSRSDNQLRLFYPIDHFKRERSRSRSLQITLCYAIQEIFVILMISKIKFQNCVKKPSINRFPSYFGAPRAPLLAY